MYVIRRLVLKNGGGPAVTFAAACVSYVTKLREVDKLIGI